MADHILQTLEVVRSQVRDLESQLAEKKRMANSLCELANIPAVYAVTESTDNGAVLPTRGDEFYGMTMCPAVRRILDARQSANRGPATVNEIHEALIVGGYQFDAANEANEKKSLRICLTKNSSIFHKLPSGKYGLVKWYPKIKPQRIVHAADEHPKVDEDEKGREMMEVEFGEDDASSKVPLVLHE